MNDTKQACIQNSVYYVENYLLQAFPPLSWIWTKPDYILVYKVNFSLLIERQKQLDPACHVMWLHLSEIKLNGFGKNICKDKSRHAYWRDEKCTLFLHSISTDHIPRNLTCAMCEHVIVQTILKFALLWTKETAAADVQSFASRNVDMAP